jgi:CRP-like cAMP-binding protein
MAVKNDTKLLVVMSDDFNSILQANKASHKAEIRDTMSASAVFSHWDDDKLETLANNATIRSFDANKEIIREGDNCASLYLVKSGMIKLLKNIPKPVKPTIGTITLSSTSSTTPKSSINLLVNGSLASSSASISSCSNLSMSQSGQKSTLSKATTIKTGFNSADTEVPGMWILNSSYGANDGDSFLDSLMQNSHGSQVTLPSVRMKKKDMVDFTVGVLGSGQVFGETCNYSIAINDLISS